MHRAVFHTLLFLGLPGVATSADQTNSEVNAAYEKLAQAIEAKDLKSFSGLLTESFRCMAADGATQTRTACEENWARTFRQVETFTSVAYEVRSLTVEAGICRVTVKRTSFFLYPGALKESLQVSRTAHEWVMQHDGWRLQYQRELQYPDDGEVTEVDRTPESNRLRQLQKDLRKNGKQAVAEFVENLRGQAPLVETIDADSRQQLVTLVYHGDPTVVQVSMAGGPYHGAPKVFERFEETNLWYRTEKLPVDARFVYFLTVTKPRRKKSANTDVLSTLSHPDELNPKLFNGGSVVWPANVAPPVCSKKKSQELRGKLSQHTLKSVMLGEERTFSVYAPPASNEKPCLLIALDGEDYSSLIPTPSIVDNLIAAQQLPPTIAVLVNQHGQRFRDLRCSERFATFLATELVPWVRARYGATDQPEHTVIAGASLGGLAAAFTSKSYPQVFGKVLSQSGAFWYHPQAGQDGWLATEFAGTQPQQIEFWMEVGSFESPSMLLNNRRLRDVLQAKGFAVEYREFNGGHDFLTWRDSLATALVHLLGKRNTASDKSVQQ